jgi:hypothetical protein
MRKQGKMPPPAGSYIIVDGAWLSERANRTDDPRNRFYKSMLSNKTYEDYEAAVRGIRVSPDTPKGTYEGWPVTGRAEFLYARRQGWIEN